MVFLRVFYPATCCCMRESWYSCWMEEHDRPLIIHLCLFLIAFCSHPHGFWWRKSFYIYKMYGSECQRVLLRVQSCTDWIWPVEYLFLAPTWTVSYTLATKHLVTFFFKLGWSTAVKIWTWQLKERCLQMLSVCRASGFFLCGRISSRCQRTRNAVVCSGHIKSPCQCCGVCWKMSSSGILLRWKSCREQESSSGERMHLNSLHYWPKKRIKRRRHWWHERLHYVNTVSGFINGQSDILGNLIT